MSAEAAAATAHFVQKWWLREPEMRFAAVFCAGADPVPSAGEKLPGVELRFQTWGALLHELREALFEIADPGVAAAKRGWWAEELQAIAAAGARHPLGQALASLPVSAAAPWTGLALALLGRASDATRAADAAEAIARLLPLAEAAIAVEDAAFGSTGGAAAARSLAVHWLLHRLPAGLAEEDGARVPMHLLARHGLTAAQLPAAGDALLRDWAGELLAALPTATPGAAFLRRARTRFDRARLQRLARLGGKVGFAEPPAPANLWRAWRAARGA